LKSWRNAGCETWSGSPEAQVLGNGHESTPTLRVAYHQFHIGAREGHNRGALGEPNTDAGAGNVSFSLKPGKYAQAQAEHPLNREESLQAALDQLDAQETLAQQDIAISSNSRCDSSNILGRINRRAECSLMRQSSSGSFVSTLKA